MELSSLRFCLVPGRKTKHGRSWMAHQRETIKQHSQRSCHLLEIVGTSRVHNGTCLKKFKRFLNFPLQAKYQSCKTTYTRQISALSAGKTCLSDSRERRGAQIYYKKRSAALSPSCSNLGQKLCLRADDNTRKGLVPAWKNSCSLEQKQL